MDQPKVPELNPGRVKTIQDYGFTIEPLEPLGAEVSGVNLKSLDALSDNVREALEIEMANRGFLVFKNEQQLEPDDFLRISCWWGGRKLNSTHGVHPATPDGNRHIFRLSNDQRHGILGVGPQWHNDGSFLPETFSHSGYHIVRPAEKGGGTCFAHQGAAFDSLTDQQKERWQRLVSVNSASGVLHPLVHRHPLTNQNSIWLHLGMTGAVIEKLPGEDEFRLLSAAELASLCAEYNQVLTDGFEDGYATDYEYAENDCVIIDNLAVAHRASPGAHLPASDQGLRIMHRSTVQGNHNLSPGFGLPDHIDIAGPSPFGDGVWKAGGVGFRWEQEIPMRN